MLTGKIYDIQGFSVQDGPGIRTTVFLKGCPLRCPWCHSPEGIEFPTELNWMSNKCLGTDACGECLSVCPKGAISIGPETTDIAGNPIRFPQVDKTICDDCGACAKACKAAALYMCGTDTTVDDVMYRLKRDQPFFEESGGGVTISGGECLCQPAFTLELLQKCKDAGVHTALDTCGFCQRSVQEELLPVTDIFLYDLKLFDEEAHQKFTGQSNKMILENFEWLWKACKETGTRIWVRTPIIPGATDTDENIRALAGVVKDKVEKWELCAFNNLCLDKYERLGRDWDFKGQRLMTKSRMEELTDIARAGGSPVAVWSGATARTD